MKLFHIISSIISALLLIAVVILYRNAQHVFDTYPHVDVKIELTRDTLVSSNDIELITTLTNNFSKTQTLLFDNPYIITFGPWFFAADVIDLCTGKSVVEEKQKSLMNSYLTPPERLKGKIISLLPGKSGSKNIVCRKSLSSILETNHCPKERTNFSFYIPVMLPIKLNFGLNDDNI